MPCNSQCVCILFLVPGKIYSFWRICFAPAHQVSSGHPYSEYPKYFLLAMCMNTVENLPSEMCFFIFLHICSVKQLLPSDVMLKGDCSERNCQVCVNPACLHHSLHLFCDRLNHCHAHLLYMECLYPPNTHVEALTLM